MVGNANKRKLLLSKAKKIKIILTDCDGVLTDGGVYYSEKGEKFIRFSRRDGMGVKRLQELVGVKVGILTSENSKIVKKRAEKLKIRYVYLGVEDKLLILEHIIKEKYKHDEIAYIGDDLNDLEIIKSVALSACPADAVNEVRKTADFVCGNIGGYGAFREFAEFIINSKLLK